MDILILNWKDIHHPQVGGAEIIVYELAKRLVKDGHKVTWFCRNFVNGLNIETIEGINIVRKGNLLTTYLFAPLYYWSLKKKPDLVIDISNTVYWQSPLWAWKSKKIAYLNQLAKNVFFYEYPVIISRIGILFEKLQYLSYKKTKFICYAESVKNDLISIGIQSKNISVFTLGLDHARYVPGRKSESPMLICVNRLVKMKRTDLVIKAVAYLIKKVPNLKLFIVGTGYERKNLQILTNKLLLEKNIFFVDEHTWFFNNNPKDKKVNLMQQAWALIFPSVKEGWGMTVTECAACGTPAIVTNVSGLVDSVKNNYSGLVLSEHPSPLELSESIYQLISNKKKRLELSKNAISWSKKFSWEKSYSQFKKNIFNI